MILEAKNRMLWMLNREQQSLAGEMQAEVLHVVPHTALGEGREVGGKWAHYQ